MTFKIETVTAKATSLPGCGGRGQERRAEQAASFSAGLLEDAVGQGGAPASYPGQVAGSPGCRRGRFTLEKTVTRQ